jgi:copper chaperone CopZ
MIRLACLCFAALLLVDDGAVLVTITFEKMHCAECRTTAESQLKRAQSGVKSVAIDGETAAVTIEEGVKLELAKLRKAIPTDLKIKSLALTARGTVTSKDAELKFQPRDTAIEFPLANREERPKAEDDKVGALKKEMGGKNRFEVSGELREKNQVTQLVLTSFKKTDWKDK